MPDLPLIPSDRYMVETEYWHPLPDGRVQCDVCPRSCRLREGQRGLCFVRGRRGDQIVLTSYGRSSGWCVDPIEKKPLHHFYPGSAVLSFGTAGCNLSCRFCQNWGISRSRAVETMSAPAGPDAIAAAARRLGCRSVAFTYNDPVPFMEYAMDVADACREFGIASVAVSAGYVNPAPRTEFFGHVDAANIDLKGFTERFYEKLTAARLKPVLETLEYLAATEVWFEITTLLIPGHNDADRDLAAECAWIVEHCGPDVPLHFTAFHPAHRMADVPRTPAATLTRAARIARDHGLRFVYVGNVVDRHWQTTWCPGCGAAAIVRDGYEIERYAVVGTGGACGGGPGSGGSGSAGPGSGECRGCGARLPGRFAETAGDWGGRRMAVTVDETVRDGAGGHDRRHGREGGGRGVAAVADGGSGTGADGPRQRKV
jgi:pyruvate formate lyase activating enzyme